MTAWTKKNGEPSATRPDDRDPAYAPVPRCNFNVLNSVGSVRLVDAESGLRQLRGLAKRIDGLRAELDTVLLNIELQVVGAMDGLSKELRSALGDLDRSAESPEDAGA